MPARHRRRHRCHWRHAAGWPAATLARARNIVLPAVDGPGARQLAAYGAAPCAGTPARRCTRSFSTTAAAILTFMTGFRRRRHALTGWHMWFDELQAVTAGAAADAARRTTVCDTGGGGAGLLFRSITPRSVAACSAGLGGVAARNRLQPVQLLPSRGADTLPMPTFRRPALDIGGAGAGTGKKFIYGYWPTLDNVSHHHGTDPRRGDGD